MNNIISQMLAGYETKNVNDEINALKEIIQEVVLCGLSRSDFFDKVAFYGGTALRIFYNIDRFSEDLDFALISPDKNFDLSKYFSYIENELNSYGINMEISTKQKKSDSNITSAFLKGDTLEHILRFFPREESTTYNNLLKNIKVKFEVDINPPIGATYEIKYKILTWLHQINLYDETSLLAGKVHAILCRNWSFRTKGRDLYDYIYLLISNAKINIELIKNKLIDSGVLEKNDDFNIDVLKDLLNKKFSEINYEDAKKDVLPFINDTQILKLWNEDFFKEITNNLK